jgi:hypothetical protein
MSSSAAAISEMGELLTLREITFARTSRSPTELAVASQAAASSAPSPA